MRSTGLAFALLLLLAPAPAGFAHADNPAAAKDAKAPATELELVVGQAAPITIDATWLHALPRRTATAAAHDQPASKWEGVALVDVLRQAGAPLDQKLRGKELTRLVRVTASDGYQVIFALSELDATFSSTNVLLVDTQDGHALGADGPYRLVVPGDKRPARWARNVIRIELIDAGSAPTTP